jgi:hypothetical protein
MDEPDVIGEIAQVYVDLMSVSDASLSDDELAEALALASQRAVGLGAIAVQEDGETITVDPTNLVAGAMRAMDALAGVLEHHTPLSRDALLVEWREAIDDPPERLDDADQPRP